MASILFVHGAGHAGWCWREHFTGWFEERGHTVAAPDLPHHGEHERGGLRFASIGSYVDAVSRAAADLNPPLVLVGHSIGGFVVQKYLERAPAELGVLLASIPPTGAAAMGMRLAARHPLSFLRTLVTLNAAETPEMARELFFTPETPADIVDACHRRLQKESFRALLDMMIAVPRPARVTTPVVVIGAEADTTLVTAAEIAATARAYGTAPRIVPGGHDMMLDTAWEQAAMTVEAAISERIPAS
jgi:pimeloyl-ACP methyl ester carboxylesterase